MIQWISNHHNILSLLLELLTLLVWFLYFQLLFGNYRRRRRPSLLINQGGGRGLDARCIISNMSEEAIYVLLVVARVETEQDCLETDVTEYSPSGGAKGRPVNELTFQGPLKAGGFEEIASFREIVTKVLKASGRSENEVDDLRNLTLNVIAEYGTDDKPVGACRHFQVVRQGDSGVLKPASHLTERMISRRQRKRMEEWLEAYL